MSDAQHVDAWIGLAGVALGFVLGEGWAAVRRWRDVRRDKRTLIAELETIVAQIPDKIYLLYKAIAALEKSEVLPLTSVRVVTSSYEQTYENLLPHLTQKQRNCLHVVYERIRVAEEFMESFHTNLLGMINANSSDDPIGSYKGIAHDMKDSYMVVLDLIRSYLDGKPIDVFPTTSGKS